MEENLQVYSNLNFLAPEQVAAISGSTAAKIDEYIGGCNLNKDELSSDLEKRSVELEDATIQLQAAKERIRVLESTETTLSQENVTLRSSSAEFQTGKNQLELQLSEAENGRKLLSSILEKREQEISSLQEDLHKLKSERDLLNQDLSESRVQHVNVESSQTMLQAQLARKENECMQLIEERNTLDSEKMGYMRQISRLQTEKSTEVSNHHHTMETLKNDLSNTEQLLDTYKQQCESLSERLRQEQARHRECRDNFISSEESHRQELASQKKLTNMYKEAEQKVTVQLEDLVRTSDEYKECLEQLTKEHEDTMAQKLSQISELTGIISAKDEHIDQIEGELKRMNDLMKESSESPDVTAELAKLIKSGLTYSQLYHKYHQTAEHLILEKAENSRVTDSFETLLREMEIMKPQVIQIRTAYEASNSMVEKLSEQLKQNLQNLDAEARKSSESKRVATRFQKEAERFKAENEDLSTQVQFLTKEIHIAKGGRVIDDDSSAQVSSSSQSSSASLISSQLVSFRDIQELQKQNQQLRSALRELSAEQEKAETKTDGGVASAALQRELENTKQEVDHLKQSRLKQEELVQSIIKQKDMYKRLFEQGEVKEAQAKASPKRPITEVDNEKLKALNDELKSSRDALTKVSSELHRAKQQNTDRERNLEDQIETIRKELTEHKLNNAKLTTQLDYSLESSKVIEKNVVAYKQEINSLRTKSEQYSNLVAKNEAVVASLRQELSKTQENSVKFEIGNQRLTNEIEMMKTSNRRLQVEADTARKDYNLQLQMLSNLQEIQTSIQQSNAEMKVHYQSRLEHSEKDKLILNKEVQTIKEQLRAAENMHQTETEVSKQKLENMQKEISTTQEKLLKSIEEQKAQRQTVMREGSVGGEAGASGEDNTVESQDLKQAKSEIDALKDQLRLSGEASDEYRQAADRLELTLREQTTTNQQIQDTLEKKNEQLQTELDSLKSEYNQIREQKDKTFEQKASLETELATTKSRLATEIAELQSSLNSYKQRLESKELIEAQARSDLHQASTLNDELSTKYQAELEKSMKSSDETRTYQNKCDSLESKVTELNNEVMKLEIQLQSNHASFEEREKNYKQTLQSLESQQQETKLQTTILHQQLEYLSHKQAPVSESAATTSGSSESTVEQTEQSAQSDDRMLELIRVLRKDKEIYETKLEGAVAESKRLQAKIVFVEGELKLAQDELAGQKSQADIDVQTKAQHAELLRKVEQINVLTDSNRMLRQEKDSLQPKIDSLDKQVQDLQQAMIPIEKKCGELSNTVQNLEGEKITLTQAVEHWKQRVTNLTQKYNQEKADDNKTQAAKIEQLNKTNATMTQQLNAVRAEVTTLKSSASSSEEDKVKLNAKIKELEETLKKSTETIEAKTQDLVKKEKMVADLRKVGRTYKSKYQKLVEESGGGGGAASGGEGATPTQSSSQTASGTEDGDGTKGQPEVSELKEQLTGKDEIIANMTSDLENVRKQLSEAKDKITRLEQELAKEKEDHAKVVKDLETFNSKHNTLKDFVANSMKPKITTQKNELSLRQAEIDTLRTKEKQLTNSLEEAQQELDEAKAKLLSLMEEKSTNVQATSQSSLITASNDTKRSQVRTIEVRPMAQHKQLTATVMPTTSQAEPLESTAAASSSAAPEEPVVGIVPPSAAVTQQSQQTFGSATPSSSSGVTPSAAVSSDFSASQYSQPSTSSFSSSQATTLLPTNIVTSQVVQSVSPQTVVSTQPTQQSTAGTEVVSQQSAPIALVVSSQQSTAAPPLVISQVISVAGTPAVTSQANVGATATVIAVQGSDEQPSGSTHATSSTTGGAGDGTVIGETDGARNKRGRDEYEADDEHDTPSIKRTREAEASQASAEEESYEQEVDDGTSQDIDTEQDELAEVDPSDFLNTIQNEEASEPNVQPISGVQQMYQVTTRPVSFRQEPTYSGSDADVVIIVSSDDEDSEPPQPSHQQVEDDEDYSGEEEEDVEDEDMEDEEEEEEEYYTQSGDEEDSTAEGEDESDYPYSSQDGASSFDHDQRDGESHGEAEEYGDEEEDNSDIIMIEDDPPENLGGVPNNAVSVSSSQSNVVDNRPTAPPLAISNYQAQGTVSIDSNINDDGIVPSTPTLALPHSRNDGFAVAVSSPNPSSEPFVFGSSSMPSSDFSGLAQQAEVMDDFAEAGMSSAASNEVDGGGVSSDPATSVSVQEQQSNVVSTESGEASEPTNILATEEVSSSEANEASRTHIEPIVWGEAPQASSQSDQPSSSSSSRPNTARRGGRGRGGRLNRPTFN